MAGVEKVLSAMNLVRPVELLPPLPLSALSSWHMTVRDQNMRTLSDAGYMKILDSTATYPDGLVPFWQSKTMDTVIMSTKCVQEFNDDQLARCPMSDTSWYAVFISAFAEYFLVPAGDQPRIPLASRDLLEA